MKIIITVVTIWLISSVSLITDTPRIKWWFDTFDSAYGQSAFGDVDGDGKPEIVFGCYRNDSCVYILNAEDGTLHWKFNTTQYQEGCNDTAPLLYDINGDGIKEIIIASSCNPFTFMLDGKNKEIIWKSPTRGSDSPPTIGDIDNDGKMEILHGQFGGYVICLDAETGTLKWEIEVDKNSWVQTAPTLVDLNNDGYLDFTVATWNFDKKSKMYAYNGKNLELFWQLDVNEYVYHGTAITDVNKDGLPDLILGDYGGMLWVVNGADGTVIWNYKAISYIGAPVTVIDLDKDGICEIIFVSLYKVYAMNNKGEVIWTFDEIGYGNIFRGVIAADIDEDNLPEILFNSSKGIVYALSGIDGKPLWNINLSDHIGKELDFNHAPVLGDFDDDGKLELFTVGGKTDYPDFSKNYGRGYCLEVGTGKNIEWTMFQENERRTCGSCFKEVNNSVEINEKSIIDIIINKNSIFASGLISGVNYNLRIFDILGNLVFDNTFTTVSNSKTIFLNTQLFSGIYLYQINSQIDLKTHSGKLIVVY